MSKGTLGELDHVIVFVPDVAAAVKEYTGRFGFKVRFADREFASLENGKGPWVGLHAADKPGIPSIPYFRVADVRKTMEELRKQGTKVGGFHEVPSGLIATAWDEAGNALGLYQPTKRK